MAGYSITITATDGASKAIEQVNKSLDRLARPVRNLKSAADKLARETGLNVIAQRFGRAAAAAQRLGRSIGAAVAPLGIITGGATLAGIVRMTVAWGEMGARLDLAARRIGVAATNLHALQGAARLAGGSAESITAGLRTLGDTLTDAVGGRNMEAVQYLNLLGISFRRNAFEARQAEEVLPELADAIARIPNPSLQARAATALLGGAAEDLLPLLRQGSAALRQYQEQARRYGVVTAEGVAAAKEMRQAQVGLGLAFEGLRNSIAERLSPVLSPLVRGFGEFLARNREIIASRVGEWAEDLAKWLRTVDWERVGRNVGQIASGVVALGAAAAGAASVVNDLVEGTVGWRTATIAAGVGFLAWTIGTTLAKAVAAARGIWVAYTTATLAATAATEAAQRIMSRGGPAPAAAAAPAAAGGLVGRLLPFLGLGGAAGVLGLGISQLQPVTPEQRDRARQGFRNRGAAEGFYGPTDQRAGAITNRLAEDLGLSREQAAGIVGNLWRESQLQAVNEQRPLVPGSRGGLGWAQWTGPRRNAFEAWAQERGLAVTSDAANYGFLLHELQNTPHGRSALAALRGTNDPRAAAGAFLPFETGGDPRAVVAMGDRARYAERAAAAAAVPVAPAPAARVDGNVNITATFRGAPPGMVVNATAGGAATVEAPRVQTALPGGGP